VRVIDLYAGVGGWAVGLKLAGFEITKSYEWWQPAADTHHANSSSDVSVGDVRTLDLKLLPRDIDIVVGSPPCTQFSYSNRGGSGDVSDGLVDLEQFLRIVKHVKPRAWAFENVPRVKGVLERELATGGALQDYADLFEDAHIEIFDISRFGIPQRRKRCLAGNLNFEILKSYSQVTEALTLGDVVGSLSAGQDPIFATTAIHEIADNEPEEPLNWEEERFNRDMKVAHPVYNGMPFPDPLDRSSRTVTATCTRVSRESLVISDGTGGKFRRLSVRERASLQSFPVNFQFLGRSHAQKLKMIGNAIPPAFTYLIGEAIKGTRKEDLVLPSDIDANAMLPGHAGVSTRPDNSGRTYPLSRRFRFCIPGLRFKSGTRFELTNYADAANWEVVFYFGDSKRIRSKKFFHNDVSHASDISSKKLKLMIDKVYGKLEASIGALDFMSLQSTWSHSSAGLHPFKLIDELESIVKEELESGQWCKLDEIVLKEYVYSLVFSDPDTERFAEQKISKYLKEIAIGSIVAGYLNGRLSQSPPKTLERA
jgi:DNA (cytosine-5)-methyltransferase 1